jgi:hypothetical protein
MELVSWKIDKYKANATDAYAEISKLNEITPQNVVDLARNEDSVLHSDFEWNDSVAGEKYRKIQAQEMIRMFVFTPVKEKNEPTRVFEISTQKNVYKPTKMIVKNEDEYQSLLKMAMQELNNFKRKYQRLTELEEVFRAIEGV